MVAMIWNELSVDIYNKHLCKNDIKLATNKLYAYADKFLTAFGTGFIFKAADHFPVLKTFG